jgi:Domain of unknown function (DUF4386)
MNQAFSSESSNRAEPIDAGDSPKSGVSIGSRTANSRWIGALFLAGFLSYGTGFALVTSVVGAPDFLSTISTHHTTLVLGAFLMLLNSVVDVGKGVLFFPILENHGKRTALTYLATMIVEVVLLAVGALCLLMIVPLAHQGVDTAQASEGFAKALASLAVQSNTMAYQIAEMSLGLGCVFLCSLLFRTRLIPRSLSIWGAIGYALLMAGTIAEIFGIHIGLAFSIPGGLFELALGFWLLIKGFQPDVYGSVAASPSRSGESVPLHS